MLTTPGTGEIWPITPPAVSKWLGKWWEKTKDLRSIYALLTE